MGAGCDLVQETGVEPAVSNRGLGMESQIVNIPAAEGTELVTVKGEDTDNEGLDCQA